MNNDPTVIEKLRVLGLSTDETKIYVELIKEHRSHLELARITGINRTKVYRIAENLQKRSLITNQTDDRGTFLVATDPATLEVELATEEEKIHAKRDAFTDLLPQLTRLQSEDSKAPGHFEVNTYEGVEGMKQMLWHELKARGEVLIFGSGPIEKLGVSKRFAERHRSMSVQAGYTIREIINPGSKPDDFTSLSEFKDIFTKRIISKEVLDLEQPIIIYNDTVAVYSWRNDQKTGYEVVSASYAHMWRSIFEMYWSQLNSPATA